MMTERQQLGEGLAKMNLSLDDVIQDKLIHFLDLVRKWNKVYNLTSRKDMDRMVARHLLDSLAILPHLNGSRIIDVGTGAGLPSIPLALLCPDKCFVSLDCVAKKGAFRTQAAIELELTNMEVVTARVEEYRPEVGFDSVISRAFSTIEEMLTVAGHLASSDGKFLAMKGVYPDSELSAIPAAYECETVHELHVPHLGAERHLAIIKRKTN